MPVLLNTLESKYYYDNLLFIAQSTTNAKEKLQQLNVTFLSVVNTLTEQREKQIFTGWFAKINFICQAYGLSTTKEEELQSLRRLLRKIGTKSSFLPSEGHFLNALRILAELIADFSDEKTPESLLNLYKNIDLPSIAFKETPQKVLETLYATILHKSEIQFDKLGQGQIQLTCDTEDFGTIKVSIADSHYYNPKTGEVFRKYELSKHCQMLVKPFQSICFTNLELLETNHFASTRNTLMIASPDYLVDATAISKCFEGHEGNSPYLYLLDKLKFFQGNVHTFGGKLINGMLDNLVENGEEDFETSFRKVLAESQTDALLIELDSDQLNEIYHKTKPQFENLKKVMQNYADKSIITEPTFISGKYGLQGRIDLLIEYAEQAERKDIIELKGTSYTNPSFMAARKDHLVQVACYNLLIESTFENRNGVSAILYSRDEFTPLRDCGKLNFEEQDAMWLRNCLVFIDLQMSKGEISFFDNVIQKLTRLNLPPYKQEEVTQFVKKWQDASPLDKAYFAELMGLNTREMLVAKVGGVSGNEPSQGFASLWRNTPAEKSENFALLHQLKILEIDSQSNEITFRRPQNAQVTAFRQGDIIVLYPANDAENLQPNKFQLLKGNIADLQTETLKVKIWNKAVDKSFFEKFAYWAIEPNLMENSYIAAYASLAEFLGFERRKKDLLYGLLKPEFEENFNADFTHILSEEQNQILNMALSAKDYFLLQGPPGTGKTSKMLRCMVDYLYHQTDETIVLLAFTNRATDEICQKITEVCGGNYIRLGNVQENNDYREKSLKSEPELLKMRQKIAETRIFVSTVASFYGSFHLIKKCDIVIVDEASQLLEASLCGILPKFKRFILIGDEKQLPAVVTQPVKFCQTDNQDLKNIGLQDLSISVFERLLLNAEKKNWQQTFAMLSTQYRTHQDIAQFISTEFYKTLKIGSAFQIQPLTIFDADSKDENEAILAKKRILFLPSQREANFKFHRGEAQKVVSILQTIRKIYQSKSAFTDETVGVITPYRAQIAEIYKLLDKELTQKVTIDTVERYQGSERDIIIISMAVNHQAQMKNLQSFNQAMTVDKKLNVALSRAKEQLVLLGNEDILKTGKFYQRFLEFLGK